MNTFQSIRDSHPDLSPAFPSDWAKPSEAELKQIEADYGIRYSDEFIQFQLVECHLTPMGDFAWDDFGWANPDLGPMESLREKVKMAKAYEVPSTFAPFKHDNGDFYCLTNEGTVVLWSHDSRDIERDLRYQWASFTDWLASSFDQ